MTSDSRMPGAVGWAVMACALVVAVQWGGLAALQSPPPPNSPGNGPYLGQGAPGRAPALFAPELGDAWKMTRSPVFIGGGREVFWSTTLGQGRGRLMTARLTAAGWSQPESLPFSAGDVFDHNPAPSLDGRRLVFASNRRIPGKAATTIPGTAVPTSDLWISERTGGGWSQPTPLGPDINTDADEDLPVLTADGTLYFGSSRPGAPGPAGIYRARLDRGRYAEPELLPAPVTTSAGEMLNFVAPDQSYVIYLSFQQGPAGGLHVSFRSPAGTWGTPVRLGEELARLGAYFLTVSPDGSALFFTVAQRGGSPRIYWVDARVVTALGAAPDRDMAVPVRFALPSGEK